MENLKQITPDNYQLQQQKKKQWDTVRHKLLEELITIVRHHGLENKWFSASTLFDKNKGTTADKSQQVFGKIWSGMNEATGFWYLLKNLPRSYSGLLLRYKYRNGFELLVTSTKDVKAGCMECEEDARSKLNHFLQKENKINATTHDYEIVQEEIRKFFIDEEIELPSQSLRAGRKLTDDFDRDIVVDSATKITLDKIVASPNTQKLHVFKKMHHTIKARILCELSRVYESDCQDKNNITDEDDHTQNIISLIEFFHKNNFKFNASAFVNEIVLRKRKLPRKFEVANEKTKRNITSIFRDIAVFTSEMLVEDDPDALVEALAKSKTFAALVLPPQTSLKEEQFQKQPIVEKIAKTMEQLGTKNQEARSRLISLLVGTYSDVWIKRAIPSVGRDILKQAKERANGFGPGMPLPSWYCKPITRNRIKPEVSLYLAEWFRSSENVEVLPDIRRSSESRKIVMSQQLIRRHSVTYGYKKYCSDAKEKGIGTVGETYFREFDKSLGLATKKSDAGLCQSCHKYGTQNYDALREVCDFLYCEDPIEKKRSRKIVDRVQSHTKRGGQFYFMLRQQSANIDWCLEYNLGDFRNENLLKCCNHAHTHRDTIILELEALFDQLLKKALDSCIPNQIRVTIDGKEGTIGRLRNNVVIIYFSDGTTQDVMWDTLQNQVNAAQYNTLKVVDYIEILRECNQRYMRHLYLDKNQTYGEVWIKALQEAVALMDYMMKLRSKIFDADTSLFHLTNSKGMSVHVFCLKNKIISEEMANNLRAEGLDVEVGDDQMIWIDSFCTNNTQGGFETLSVIQASIEFAAKIYSGMKKLNLVSDAGSGYKTIQCILGARAFAQTTGVTLGYWLFNASGEGKRWVSCLTSDMTK